MQMIEAVFDGRRELFLDLMRDLQERLDHGELMPTCSCLNTELVVEFALNSNLVFELEGGALDTLKSAAFQSIMESFGKSN